MDNTDNIEDDQNNLTNTNYNKEQEVQWTEEHEYVLVEWADKAMCYRWLHSRSHLAYANLKAWFTIPVICMSTITGTANFAFQKYDSNIQDIASNVIGAVNILAAIISTIDQFLKISEFNEAHRVSSISWDKFYRNIKVELAKHPSERINATHMLKISKEEFDRLMETSPMIKNNIVNEFKNTFNVNNDPIKQEAFKQLKKPEICDELISTDEFRHSWYKEEKKTENYENHIHLIELNKKKKINEQNETTFNNFKNTFFDLHNRDPLENEIIDNLNDKIDEETLQKLIKKNDKNI
jgi:hypothetical protein